MKRLATNGAGRRVLLSLLGSIGLVLVYGDIFLVPGYFDLGFAISVGMFFLVGLGIALLAGREYRLYDDPPRRGIEAVLISPPVGLYLAGSIVLGLLGFLEYNPRPTGH